MAELILNSTTESAKSMRADFDSLYQSNQLHITEQQIGKIMEHEEKASKDPNKPSFFAHLAQVNDKTPITSWAQLHDDKTRFWGNVVLAFSGLCSVYLVVKSRSKIWQTIQRYIPAFKNTHAPVQTSTVLKGAKNGDHVEQPEYGAAACVSGLVTAIVGFAMQFPGTNTVTKSDDFYLRRLEKLSRGFKTIHE